MPGTPTTSRRTFLAGTAVGGAALLLSQITGQGAANAKSAVAMNVGRGLADMTGEPLGAGMNGYAVPEQTSSGLHHRQFARAFIFEGDGGDRLVHVTADMGLMFQSIQMEVLRRLRARHGDLYHEGNVLIGASHTHVAPGGTSGHLMVDLTTLGFRPVTFEAAVGGIVTAVERAHDDVTPSTVALTVGTVPDAGVNRSRQAFDRNPAPERDAVPGGVNTDSTTLHVSRGSTAVGLINWYGIHPTTFGPEYTFISGDSKGYAAWLMENTAGVDHRHPAGAPYVAASAMSTPGDISPNHELVPGSGPGRDEYDSARILGRRQVEGVTGEPVQPPGGGVDGRWSWTDMSAVDVAAEFTDHGRPGRTGPAVLGAAFAASSQEDGGGMPELGFNEGERGGTPWVRQLNSVVVPASVAAIHEPKEMLLPVGYVDGLLQQVHLFHVHRVAGFTIVSLAFEPTTVAGLRIRSAVAEVLGTDPSLVMVQGYVSGYGHYITTPEEYDQQDYEGGATAFGRDTLGAAVQTISVLAGRLRDGLPNQPGRPAGDLTGLIPTSPDGAPGDDQPPAGHAFGDVLSLPDGQVATGDTVRVDFAAANPNHDLRHEAGYHVIETADGTVVADDSHEDSRLSFTKDGAATVASIEWDTTSATPGQYTVWFTGSSRDMTGSLTPFEGSTTVTLAE